MFLIFVLSFQIFLKSFLKNMKNLESKKNSVSNDVDSPPSDPDKLASWFAEGVRSELEALEKEGGTQSYEVLSGQIVESKSPTQAIFQFLIADATNIPEDATGRLKTNSSEYSATVINQQANRIQIFVESNSPLPTGVSRAMLIIDNTVLLRKLAEALEGFSATPTGIGPLASVVFHPAHSNVDCVTLPNIESLSKIVGELPRVLEQACGSTITYIWGPPGTGKTFGIAHLITALIENGERVLVASHTHKAVDQALYETVKPEEKGKKSGPLSMHPSVKDGKILRVGRTTDRKIPEGVKLDKVVEVNARKLEAKILKLEDLAKPLNDKCSKIRKEFDEWTTLDELEKLFRRIISKTKEYGEEHIQDKKAISRNKDYLSQSWIKLKKAQRAWFRQQAKIEQASLIVKEAEYRLHKAETNLQSTLKELEKNKQLENETRNAFKKQNSICQTLTPRKKLESESELLNIQLSAISNQIKELQEEISKIEKNLIDKARAVFCTLTKNYMGKELEEQIFDAVIVDEISMALPPLIFLVASRAKQRVILVGDFKQLPPIVRSDTEISNARLKVDTFHMSGVAKESEPTKNCPVLAKLTTQRRMLPAIADVARHLTYGFGPDGIKDYHEVFDKKVPEWLDFLPSEPLIIVDTADLYCWCGKQPGSLSRFNFYSATIAIELAAMVATNIPEPDLESPPPIGIVTPYAAQRRLLSKLCEGMGLSKWVTPGTVHTFQGSEAELIIFDSVLDEPYWSARLCTPRNLNDVIRDLNVAVTRAESKFVFIGSSEWLNKNAKPASGLGKMWSFLRDRALLVSATELVESGFLQRVSKHSIDSDKWMLPYKSDDQPMHEILDEITFFERFTQDVNSSSKSFFGLAPYFGEYRWPRIQPLLLAALERNIEVTLVIPPIDELKNPKYVEDVIHNLQKHGAIVICAGGLHGKDIVIDEKIHYTGSLNWTSHRGRSEIMHRTENTALAKLVLQYMQAKYIRLAAVHEDGTPRACPGCGGLTRIVNQRRQHGPWDFQAMKVGCADYKKTGCKYLRDVNERPPLKEVPICQVDGKTKYRRIRRGRGEAWQCPKHPKKCPTFKTIPGDP